MYSSSRETCHLHCLDFGLSFGKEALFSIAKTLCCGNCETCHKTLCVDLFINLTKSIKIFLMVACVNKGK